MSEIDNEGMHVRIRGVFVEPAPLNTEVTIEGDGSGDVLPAVLDYSERLWAWVQSPSGRESAFTRVRHILIESDPYSGFGRTACGRESRDPYNEKTEEDILASEQLDGIPPAFCSKCDRVTR